MANFQFTNEQIERYSRHIILPDVGGKGQEKLLNASVLLIGAGGLGSPCGMYLAAAGVGHIGVVDDDDVEISNLQRQIFHRTSDIGRHKTDSAMESINSMNKDVKVDTYKERITAESILDIIEDYDIIIEGSDNFPTKFLVNDACVLRRKRLSMAGILRFVGQVMSIFPHEGPCYRCLFVEPPPPGQVPSCQEAGILGSVAGIVGTIQAIEVIKMILGIGNTLNGNILVFEALPMSFRRVPIAKNPNCPVCGNNPTITKLEDYHLACELLFNKNQ